ncbi:MAG: hypothetical protein R6U62_00195 [Bacteroidales bacterium]
MSNLSLRADVGSANAGLDTNADIDENEYVSVAIGEQLWMWENFWVTRFWNRGSISTGLTNEKWANTEEEAYSLTFEADMTDTTSDYVGFGFDLDDDVV